MCQPNHIPASLMVNPFLDTQKDGQIPLVLSQQGEFRSQAVFCSELLVCLQCST
jgi:hypothetical protein